MLKFTGVQDDLSGNPQNFPKWQLTIKPTKAVLWHHDANGQKIVYNIPINPATCTFLSRLDRSGMTYDLLELRGEWVKWYTAGYDESAYISIQLQTWDRATFHVWAQFPHKKNRYPGEPKTFSPLTAIVVLDTRSQALFCEIWEGGRVALLSHTAEATSCIT